MPGHGKDFGARLVSSRAVDVRQRRGACVGDAEGRKGSLVTCCLSVFVSGLRDEDGRS